MKSRGQSKEVTIYICEVCGEESEAAHSIRSCEARHKKHAAQSKCDHVLLYGVSPEYEGLDTTIYRTCKKCHMEEAVLLTSEDIEKHQDICEQLFRIGDNRE